LLSETGMPESVVRMGRLVTGYSWVRDPRFRHGNRSAAALLSLLHHRPLIECAGEVAGSTRPMNSFRKDFRSIAAIDPVLRQPQSCESINRSAWSRPGRVDKIAATSAIAQSKRKTEYQELP
jgi:hypothetical protein